MAITFGFILMLSLPGQVLVALPLQEDPAVRLAYMKESVAPFNIHRAAAGSPPFRLRAEPIFRLDNQVTRVKDSAIFLWTDPETGRPEATIQMFRAPEGFWNDDWTSLAASPIVAEVGTIAKWRPKPGVTFRPVPEAPVPAASPKHGSANSERWPRSSRQRMISWLRDGPSSGSCRSHGSATARPVLKSRMAPCSPSRSGPSRRSSS
jgi:hypothetical protein